MARLTPDLAADVGSARAACGLTQEQLAELVGVSRQTISAIEQGEYSPSTVLALRLAIVLDRPVERLFALPEHAASQLRQRRALQLAGRGPQS